MSIVVAKKIFASAVAAATIMGSLALPFVSHAAAHAVGTNVKSSDGTIWMITTDGQRRAYTSAGAFLSYGFNSFAAVVDANADDLALPAGSFIPPQDGKVICSDRGADLGTCYLITSSMKAGFTSAAVFTGRGFSFARSTKGDVSFLQTTSNINDTTSANLPGVLINNGGTVQLRGASSNMGIPDLATFNSWGYSFADVVPANLADKAIVQAGIMAARTAGQLSPSTVANPGNPGNPSGPLSVSLASSNPASGVIVVGQATAPLLAFTVTGSGTLNSVTLMRSGISDQNSLTNVYLYDGASRLTDGYSFNSQSTLTMNNLGIVVNGSRTLWVKADVAGTVGQTVAVALTSITAAGASASSANVMGNTMTVASGSTLATASLGANSIPGATINAGTTGYVFFSAPLQVNTRTLQLLGANFRMVGSAPVDALANLKMFVDGVDSGVVGNVITTNGSNYVSFDFTASPKSLTTGSHTLDVRADIQKGSNRNVTFSIQNASDLMIKDPQVGVNIAVGGTIPNNAGQINIGTGSVTVVLDPTFQAVTNLTGGASNATIAKFKLHAYGEDVKVQSLVVSPTVANGAATTYVSGTTTTGAPRDVTVASTAGFYPGDTITVAGGTPGTAVINSITSSTVMNVTFSVTAVTPAGAVTNTTGHNNLDDVTLFFNGSQVGTQQDFTGTALTFTLGSQMIVPAGTDSFLEVHANVRSTTGINYTAGTIAVNLPTGVANAQGQSSFNTVLVPPAGVTQPAITVQTGLLAVSSNPGFPTQSANPNTAGVKIGSYVLQNQSSSESVRVTSLNVDLSTGSCALTNFAGLRTSETSGSGATPVQPLASNTFSVDHTLAPGATWTLDIFADSSTLTGCSIITRLTVTSIGSTSNVLATSAQITGQTINMQAGTLVNPPTVLTATSTAAQYIAAGNGGAVDASKATFNFVSNNGSAVISELKFTVTASAGTPVTAVKVGSVSATPVAGVAYLTGLNLMVPNGGSGLTQDVFISYSEVGTSGIAPGTTAAVNLTQVKYTAGGTTTVINPTVSPAPATMTLVGSKPALSIPSTSQGGLNISGTTKIGEVTVTADPKGNIKVNDIVFTVSSSGFSTAPTAIGSPVISSSNSSSSAVAGSACTPASLVVTCEFGSSSNTDYDGLSVAPGSPVTLSLFGTLTGAAAIGAGTPTITSSVGASTFNWDDTSTNGAAGSFNLSGTLIYGFPTNSFSIHQ